MPLRRANLLVSSIVLTRIVSWITYGGTAKHRFRASFLFLKTKVNYQHILSSIPGTHMYLARARKRADEQYNNTCEFYRQNRVSVAKINKQDLLSAVYRFAHDDPRGPSQIHRPDIPIRIHRRGLPTSTYIIPIELVAQGQVEVWLSMFEIRRHFGFAKDTGQDDEWLACGYIPKWRVDQIHPYDGKTLHEEAQLDLTTSRGYTFNFYHQIWLLETSHVHDYEAIVLANQHLRRQYRAWTRIASEFCNAIPVEDDRTQASLQSAWLDLGSALKPILDYYENFPSFKRKRKYLVARSDWTRMVGKDWKYGISSQVAHGLVTGLLGLEDDVERVKDSEMS
jgi:hypothetical protein